MSKTIFKMVMLVFLAGFVAGCASTAQEGGGVTTRAYVIDKERVDQDMTRGNQGYLMGTPKDRGEYKKTRKMYVVEFTKDSPEEDAGDIIPPPRPKPEARPIAVEPVEEPEWTRPVEIPRIQEAPVVKKAAAVQAGCQEYVVKSGDTLQKISKKFYGSYSKYGRIYEANKDRLKSPESIYPGMKLCVPGAGGAAATEEPFENLK